MVQRLFRFNKLSSFKLEEENLLTKHTNTSIVLGKLSVVGFSFLMKWTSQQGFKLKCQMIDIGGIISSMNLKTLKHAQVIFGKLNWYRVMLILRSMKFKKVMWWKWFSSVEDEQEWLANDTKWGVSTMTERLQTLLRQIKLFSLNHF